MIGYVNTVDVVIVEVLAAAYVHAAENLTGVGADNLATYAVG